MLRFRGRSRAILGLETSAMADIIFLLLIFFLLSSSFILRTEIPVTPPTSTSTATEDEQPVVLTITRSGKLYLDKSRVSLDGLKAALKTRLTSKVSKAVVIRGDREIRLAKLVEVMDAAREAGARKLALATRGKERSRKTH